MLNDGDTRRATAARGEYVTQVERLVGEHSAALFALVTAAAERAPHQTMLPDSALARTG